MDLLPLQKRFSSPIKREISYPVSESEDLEQKTIVTFAWLTVPLVEQQELLALAVIDCALMDTDASPLKAHLLQSGLCIQAEAYMDAEMSEVPYAIVCKGCNDEKIEELELCLKKGLEKIAREGIPGYLIDAAIHQIEFSRTEITGDHAPFGLALFMRSGLAKQHGCPPENALTLHSLFDQLLKEMENPDYLKKLVRKHLIDNNHFIRLILRPDPLLNVQEAKEEREMLQALRSHLTKEDVKKILLQTKDLARYQKQTEEQKIDCLPKVGVEDIPLLIRDFSLDQSKSGALHVFHHSCFTNHILYVDLLFDLPKVTQKDLPYLQLLLTILPELGSADRNYIDNLEYIQAHTGGIGFSFSLHSPIDPNAPLRPAIHLRGKALARKADKLLQLMRDEVTLARFDEKGRIAELIEQVQVSLENRLPRNAARYAVQMAQSSLSQATFISNASQGLNYFQSIQKIAEHSKTHLDEVVATLSRLYNELFSLNSPHLVVACDADLFSRLQRSSFYGLDELPIKPAPAWENDFLLPEGLSHGRVLSTPVAFNAEAFSTLPLLHPDAPALHLASQLFENLTLHPLIREQGGAYGSGATYLPILGQFTFNSYRDPHIVNTWEAFHKAVDDVSEKKFDEIDIEEGKLGLIQSFDAPVSPGSRAMAAYSWWREGRTPAIRQYYRDRLLSMHAKDVSQAVVEHLRPNLKKAIFVTFAGKELLEKENKLLEARGKGLPLFPL